MAQADREMREFMAAETLLKLIEEEQKGMDTESTATSKKSSQQATSAKKPTIARLKT